MPDISLRRLTDEQYDAIKQKAANAGESMEGWVKALILNALKEPIVERRYVLRAFSMSPVVASVVIRRIENDMNHQSSRGMSEEQQTAFELAISFVKRNGAGDRENAIKALGQGFENVFETLM